MNSIRVESSPPFVLCCVKRGRHARIVIFLSCIEVCWGDYAIIPSPLWLHPCLWFMTTLCITKPLQIAYLWLYSWFKYTLSSTPIRFILFRSHIYSLRDENATLKFTLYFMNINIIWHSLCLVGCEYAYQTMRFAYTPVPRRRRFSIWNDKMIQIMRTFFPILLSYMRNEYNCYSSDFA